jgi:hypothetical protein
MSSGEPGSSSSPEDRRRATLVRVLAIVAVLVLIEGMSYIGLWALPRVAGVRAPRTAAIFRDQTTRIETYFAREAGGRDQLDPELGWRYRAGYGREGDRINSQGLRSERDYAPTAAPDVVRVAAFGDSFVYGNEVDTKDAWSSAVERLHPNIELLNYGVGGYGDDQAYLRFAREGLTYHPRMVILGFTPDDLRRLTNVYRRFIDDREFAWTKPRFRLGPNGALTLMPPPIHDSAGLDRLRGDPKMAIGFGEHDQWFQPWTYRNPLYDYSAAVRLLTVLGGRVHRKALDSNRLVKGAEFNPASEAFGLQVAISQRFADDARAAQATSAVVMLPDKESVRMARAGKRVVYAPLTDSLRARGIQVIDTAEEFARAGADADVDGWFAPGGHYSPRGNEIVARMVGREILAHAGQRPQ